MGARGDPGGAPLGTGSRRSASASRPGGGGRICHCSVTCRLVVWNDVTPICRTVLSLPERLIPAAASLLPDILSRSIATQVTTIKDQEGSR